MLSRRNTLPIAPWLTAPIVVSVRGRKGIRGARRRMCSPRVVPKLNIPRVLDRSSGVSAAIAVILGVSLRTVAGRSRARKMARAFRGGAIAIIGSTVRICIGPPSAIGGPIARIAEFFGRPSALATAVSFDVQSHHRAATAGSCTPPAGAVRSHTTKSYCFGGLRPPRVLRPPGTRAASLRKHKQQTEGQDQGRNLRLGSWPAGA